MPDLSVYSPTKAAIRSFARTWTTDLEERGIKVNALAPGYIWTQITVKAGVDPKAVDTFYEQAASTIPAGRVGKAVQVTRQC